MDLNGEKDLIERARKNPQAFGQLYEEFYPVIFSYLIRRTGDIAIAEEITTETFYKALRSLRQFKWRSISFSAWLYRIAINEVNYYFRRGKLKPCSLDLLREGGFEPPTQDDIEAEVEDAETQLQQHKQFMFVLQADLRNYL